MQTIKPLSKLLITLCVSFYACTVFSFGYKNKGILNGQIQKTINTDQVKYQLPALSVSISLPEAQSPQNFVSGYSTLLDNKKITPNTLFQIGSITKTFTAAIVLNLVSENKLDLQQKIGTWFPQYPRWKNISVDNLLRHTSGISNYSHGDEFDKMLRDNPNKNFSLDELALLAYKKPDFFKPGERYNYTNTDYILLGMIIEKVTHQSLQQVFNNYFHQFHLSHTFYVPNGYPDKIVNQIAHGYNRDGTFKFNQDVTSNSLSSAASAGGIISTPNDIINWLHQLFTGRVISNTSLANMMTIISEEDAKLLDLQKIDIYKYARKSAPFIEIGSGAGVGLVYFKSSGLAFVHAGGMPGYESFYLFDPCKGIYVVLMYSVKPKQQLIFAEIAHDILAVLNKSEWVNHDIKAYQHNHSLPIYCKRVASASPSAYDVIS